MLCKFGEHSFIGWAPVVPVMSSGINPVHVGELYAFEKIVGEIVEQGTYDVHISAIHNIFGKTVEIIFGVPFGLEDVFYRRDLVGKTCPVCTVHGTAE